MVSGCHALQQTLQGSQAVPVREHSSRWAIRKNPFLLLLTDVVPWPVLWSSYLNCAVPTALWTLQAQSILLKQLIRRWFFFNREHIATISKSKAKLRSKSEWKPKFISLHFPAAIKKLSLSTHHCLVCKWPGNALQWKDTCFRRICWKLFTKIFSNLLLVPHNQIIFWINDIFKELVSLKYCWGNPFSRHHNI